MHNNCNTATPKSVDLSSALELPSGIGSVYALVYTGYMIKAKSKKRRDACHTVLSQAIWFHINVLVHVYLKYFYSEIDFIYTSYVHLVVKPNFQEARYS